MLTEKKVDIAVVHEGINLPRTADDQVTTSSVQIISESQAMPGDLIFFEGTYNSPRQITHVGVYLGDGNFYNAQGRGVRTASLTEGNGYWGKFTRHFGRITTP